MSDETPQQVYPSNQTPISEASSGLITVAWNYLFLRFYRKTGGSGVVMPAEEVVADGEYTYTADRNGVMIVPELGVNSISIVRGGQTIPAAVLSGPIPLVAGDQLVLDLAYSRTLHFLPSEASPPREDS